MGRSQETFSKKEKEKKRLKKRKDKELKKQDRKDNSEGGGLDNMLAYVDEYGNIVDTPPDLSKKREVSAESIEIGVPKREESDEPTVRTGVVVFFNDSKGYGFIRELGSDEKFFVHANGLMQPVVEHDKVEFDLERGQKGMNAINVTIVKPPSQKPAEPKDDNETESEATAEGETETPSAEEGTTEDKE